MLLRRMTQHVKDQNWFAVGLELVILVIGVFIGMQVSNWNGDRAEIARTQEYLERLQADLTSDAETVLMRQNFYAKVSDYGKDALAYAEADDATRTANWSTVLAFFQATQIFPWYRNNSTYDELKSAGELSLLSDNSLRSALAEYYVTNSSQVDFILRFVPEYRETLRELTPSVVTTHIWTHCHQTLENDVQRFLDCDSPITNHEAQQILDGFLADPEVLKQLRFWMSTLNTTQRLLEIAGGSTHRLREQITQELGE